MRWKLAEIGSAMPVSAAATKPSKAPLASRKMAADLSPNEHLPEEKQKAPGKLPQMKPHVHVDKLELIPEVQIKKAQYTALDGKYPLDDYAQVKVASAYFDYHAVDFTPKERRVFAQNMVKRANDLGVLTSKLARHYASDNYGPNEHLFMQLDARRPYVNDVGNAVLDKIAQIAGQVPPDEFAELLGDFDRESKIAHLYGTFISDNYLTTLGYKEASWSADVDGEIVNAKNLADLVDKFPHLIKQRFTEDIWEGMLEDPTGTFDTLPLDQKKIMGRMALSATTR